MKISWNYLQSFFSEPLTKHIVLERLTMAGLEVEEETAIAPGFSGIVVGEVIECERHPDADKLSLCKVDIGTTEPLQIICGASNVKVGIKIPCAKVGAVLPGDFKIAERKMRGIVSYGMLCSGDEIGCPNGVDGLYILASDAPLGADIRQYLDLNDSIIEFKITPNRGDCLSYSGLIREIAALTGASYTAIDTKSELNSNINSDLTLDMIASDACPHYVALKMDKVNNNLSSPLWLTRILERSGIRPISPVVDITNYVMLALGQPMHAFDSSKIHGGIRVRMAETDEELKLIDGKLAKLDKNTLIIADKLNQPIAIAGVMGGLDSGVTNLTTSILLESAHFSPDVIQSKAKRYGVSSDSAFRFERGVDSQIQHEALQLAAFLLQDICGAVPMETLHYSHPELYIKSKQINVTITEINNLIGQVIPPSQIVNILNSLGCTTSQEKDLLTILVPSYRFDLAIKEDIVEEIIRVYGYDKIQALMPKMPYTMNSLDESQNKFTFLRKSLVNHGFNEIISYAFIEEKYAEIFADKDKKQVRVKNPIAGLSVMRNNLWSDLIKALNHNLNRGYDSLRIFELARVFHGENAEEQPLYLAGLIHGKNMPLNWAEPSREVDFFDLKFIVNELLEPFGKVNLICAKDVSILHPGRSAKIVVDGQIVGLIGQLHPKLLQELGLDRLPYLFEINLEQIGQIKQKQVRATSKFQKVSRDLAFIFKQNCAIGEVLCFLQNLAMPDLISVRIFDIFQGGNLQSDEKSVAFNFIFQADHTLAEEEITLYLNKIKQTVETQFGGQLR